MKTSKKVVTPKKAVRKVVGKKTLKSIHAQNFVGDASKFSFSGSLSSSNYGGLSSHIPAPILVNAVQSSEGSYDLKVAYFNPRESVTRLSFHDLSAPALTEVLSNLDGVDLMAVETSGWLET